MNSPRAKRSSNRRVRRPSSADYLLEVTTRSAVSRRRRRRALWGWVSRALILLVVGVGAYFGIRAGFDRFFFNNPDYTITRIDMELDGILTREEVLEMTGLREGDNIFAVNLASVERTLRALPIVRDVRIERVLPDRLSVVLRARDPVAWLVPGSEQVDPSSAPGAVLLDPSGMLMRARRLLPEYLHLPAIYGIKISPPAEGDGNNIPGVKPALDLIAALAERPDHLLRIRAIDVSRGYRMDVFDDQHALISFGADKPGEQLDRLQTLLLHCAESGRTLQNVNLMVRRNTPVVFAMAAGMDNHKTPEDTSMPATPH
jgi:cell division protein FtsQ